MTSRTLLFSRGRALLLAMGMALLVTSQSSADKTDSPDNRLKDKSSFMRKTDKKATASSKKKKKRQPPITNLKVDPKAQHVALFDGIDGGALTVKLVAQSALNGSLYIANNTQKPLTVEMPEAFAAVQVLRQFGGGGRGAQAGGAGMAHRQWAEAWAVWEVAAWVAWVAAAECFPSPPNGPPRSPSTPSVSSTARTIPIPLSAIKSCPSRNTRKTIS